MAERRGRRVQVEGKAGLRPDLVSLVWVNFYIGNANFKSIILSYEGQGVRGGRAFEDINIRARFTKAFPPSLNCSPDLKGKVCEEVAPSTFPRKNQINS